jgi:hypothetical protein
MYVLQATNYDQNYLEMAVDYVESIEAISKLDCGFATVNEIHFNRLIKLNFIKLLFIKLYIYIYLYKYLR